MKLILYVSKANNNDFRGRVVPPDLAKIISQARLKNKVNNISGTLCYKQGRYLQVIEGEDEDVDRLYGDIVRDPRHKNVVTILDIPTTERFMKISSMKLISVIDKDPGFRDFIQKQSSAVLSLSIKHKQTLSLFYNLDDIKRQSSSDSSTNHLSESTEFKNNTFSLLRWPDFNVVEPEPNTLDLCARMLKKAHTFNELKTVSEFKNDTQLKKLLLTLDELGILEKNLAINGVVAEPYQLKPASSFYQKMSRFLGRA